MKSCSGCKQVKPFGEYHKNRSEKDGLQHYCKVCIKKRDAANYVKSERVKRGSLVNESGQKKCDGCGEPKDASMFHRNKSKEDGLQGYCRTCAKQRDAESFQRRKPAKQARQNERRKELSAWLRGIKDSPCIDCGTTYPYYAMHFDHLPGNEKVLEISLAVGAGWGKERILEEIEKCELVCAIRHAKRTHQRLTE